MLIYEKKVNTAGEGEPEVLVRKLYGTLANVPSADDEEITVSGGTFEIDDKGRVLIPKESDEEDEGEDDAEAEEEKDIVKLVYGNYKKLQFSVSGTPDFDNDPEITVAIGDTSIIPEPEEPEPEPPTPAEKVTITVVVTPEGAGTVSGAGEVDKGAEATLTATPADGYTFTKWDDDSTSATRTITPTADMTVTATFTANNQPEQ